MFGFRAVAASAPEFEGARHMPHRTSRRRRFAGRALALSVLGWALFSRERNQAGKEVVGKPADFDVDWAIPTLDIPEPVAAPVGSTRSRTRPKRRLATSLAFATLFFAGAALSAGAGDMIANAVESGASTSAEETTEPSEDEVATVEEPAPEEDVESPGAEPPAEDEPTDDGDPGTTPSDESGQDEVEGEEPTSTEPDTAEQPDPDEGTGEGESPAPDDGSSGGGESNGGGSGHEPGGSETGPTEPPGEPLIEPDPGAAPEASQPDPEVTAEGSAATIWLHQAMPDPTPAARRLVPAFARMLRREAARAHGDWALVLGVLRADGRVGRRPASRATVRRLATRLVKLGARRDEWAAVLALRGRTTFADRAVAGARLHRAVGLRALVVGLDAAKPELERRTLADRRISIYAAGRADVVAHRIDVRVLVAIRYLAEAFGQVTVSSLQSGHRLYARPGVVSAHIYGLAVDIAALGGLSMVGNQGPGSVTEQAVRAILLLPPGLHARQVISLIGLGGASFAMSNHDDHIHIGF
jgi:hypothetical protein